MNGSIFFREGLRKPNDSLERTRVPRSAGGMGVDPAKELILFSRIPLIGFSLVLAFLCIISVPVFACTIFVLTDSNQALFFNNEDWLNPKTRIWFVPAGDGHYGCAYVGFDNGYAQGGLNTKGLAFDWVAGYMEKWKPRPNLKSVRGNPSERMLETCTTVDDAIAFYRTHREPDFSRAKVLVADRTGASVIIGAKDGQLQFEKANQSRGFGYGSRTLDKMLATPPKPTVANGAAILRACLQEGPTATQYSNVFDLKSGNIFLFQFHEQNDSVKLNLAIELAKGAHYYDIPQIRRQLARAPIPLLTDMKRFLLDEYKPIPDREPNVTKHIRAIIQNAVDGSLRPNDYTAELWKKLSSSKKEIQADLNSLGEFVSLTLVDRGAEGRNRSYRYRVEFKNAVLLQHYALDTQNKVALIQSESFERKPDTRVGDN